MQHAEHLPEMTYLFIGRELSISGPQGRFEIALSEDKITCRTFWWKTIIVVILQPALTWNCAIV